MTPRAYWLGWIVMATGFLVLLGVACWYLGSKLDAMTRALLSLKGPS
jgi:hypothetical protein